MVLGIKSRILELTTLSTKTLVHFSFSFFGDSFLEIFNIWKDRKRITSHGLHNFVILHPFTVLQHLIGITAISFTGLLQVSSISQEFNIAQHRVLVSTSCHFLPEPENQRMQGTNLLMHYDLFYVNLCSLLSSI